MKIQFDIIDHQGIPGYSLRDNEQIITGASWKYDNIYKTTIDTDYLNDSDQFNIPVTRNSLHSKRDELQEYFDINDTGDMEFYLLTYPKKNSIRNTSEGMTINGTYGSAYLGSDTTIKIPKKLKREEILETAYNLITGDRAEQYDTKDDATGNFQRIADLWTPVLGREITPTEVALCLIQLKVARVITSNGHQDSWVDIAGYAGLGFEVSDNA